MSTLYKGYPSFEQLINNVKKAEAKGKKRNRGLDPIGKPQEVVENTTHESGLYWSSYSVTEIWEFANNSHEYTF